MTPQLAQLELRGYAPTVRVESRDELRVAVSDSVHVVEGAHIPSTAETFVPSLATLPDVLLQAAVVTLGDHTSEGHLIAGVAVAWFEIISQLKRDPEFLFKIHWRTLEELVAGAYERAGWPEVVLTPRSGDAGRDIIATRPGVGSIRIIDQVKAYRPGRVVTAAEIREMLGVLEAEQNVSKGLVTTTSRFAPGIEKDVRLARLMPYRLELKDGGQLLRWLIELNAEHDANP